MHRKLLVVSAFVFSMILLMNLLVPHESVKAEFHTAQEIVAFKKLMMRTIGPGEYFLHSSECRGCHGFDSSHTANIDENGNSVNLFDHWQSTMMANSARDPLWRAKVSHEILVNPSHAAELQDKCTSCHAPMGKYNSFFHGALHYGLTDLAIDSLGQDGVACESCHTISPVVGHTFSGEIPYDTTRNVYGPFQAPFVGPMQLYEGYTPTYSDHMNQARMCSSCHTLITQSVDTSGIFTGGIFVEQATYHEYLNSQFPADSITCQTCHMPHLQDPVIIANGFAVIQPRYPFNQHVFAGANAFMLTMIKNNKSSLGADADDWKFDSTIAASKVMLRDSATFFSLQIDSSTANTGYFSVRIQNRAGHKFPSGYPSRRTVVQFIVTDGIGDTVFRSGTFTNDFRVVGETPPPSFEPHHDVISQNNVPQIYELVMGDVNNHFTSVLERAAVLLKDNRIPPHGFTSASYQYDTVMITNDAVSDPDFNKVNSTEGTGVDIVHYRVPLTGAIGTLNIRASLFYQSVPPKWLDEMFTYSSPQIDSFHTMFDSADQTPLLIASDSIINIILSAQDNQVRLNDVEVYPTISTDGKIVVKSRPESSIQFIELYSYEGKKISQVNYGDHITSCLFFLPFQQTVYIMKIITGTHTYFRKVIRQ